MAKFFIIHRSYGNSKENWFPWLKKELEKKGNTVFVPDFPTPENQSLDSWMKVFEKYKKEIDENTVFIGHSLAPAFILSILEKTNTKIRACFFVSGFLNLLGNETFDKINKSFVDKKFNWKKIKQNCDRFYIIQSDNDPYVPMKEAVNLAEKLGTTVILIEKAGHFNENSGFKKFDFLLNLINSEIKNGH